MGLLIRATYAITFGGKKVIPYTTPDRGNIDGALDKFKRSGGVESKFPQSMDYTIIESEDSDNKDSKKEESKSQDNDRDYKKHPKSKPRVD